MDRSAPPDERPDAASVGGIGESLGASRAGPVVAVVLAAGGSSRFGSAAKQTVTIRGRPMVAIAVAGALGAGCFDAVVVVQGAVDCRAALGPMATEVEIVDNPDWGEGMATSLQRGVAAADRLGAAAVVVGLADQPGVGADAWRAVALATDPSPIVVASYGGRRGNPVRLERSVWGDLPTTGDEGARALMARRNELVTAVACSGDATDVDTPEDLERWN